MKATRFVRMSRSAIVALLLCMLYFADRVEGLLGPLFWLLFTLLTGLLYFGSGRWSPGRSARWVRLPPASRRRTA